MDWIILQILSIYIFFLVPQIKIDHSWIDPEKDTLINNLLEISLRLHASSIMIGLCIIFLIILTEQLEKYRIIFIFEYLHLVFSGICMYFWSNQCDYMRIPPEKAVMRRIIKRFEAGYYAEWPDYEEKIRELIRGDRKLKDISPHPLSMLYTYIDYDGQRTLGGAHY